MSSRSSGALPFPITQTHLLMTRSHPLKEYLIKFSMMNGMKTLTINFKTFTESTRLDYAKGKYVSHPSTEEVKAELAKIVNSPILLDRIPVLKIAFPVAWRIMFTFVIQVHGGNYSSTEQGSKASGSLPQKRKTPKSKKPLTKTKGIRKSQPLPESTTTDPKDSGGNVQPADKGLPSTAFDEGMVKTTPLPEGPRRDKDSEGLKPPADMELQTNHVIDPSGTDAEYQVDENQSTRLRYHSLTENEGKTSSEESDNEEVFAAREEIDEYIPPTDESASDSSSPKLKKYDNIMPLTERQLTDKLVQSIIDCLDKNSTERAELLKALNRVTETLKVVQEAVKDDLALNKKVIEATEAYINNSTSLVQKVDLVTHGKKGMATHSHIYVSKVSIVSPNINTACPQVSTANFSDNNVYAFMVENPNGSNLLQQDLEQIHEDDLEAMDLKWLAYAFRL
ncbi:hypothetical protein Tco_0164361 [Tanacetum coccineum]